MNTQKFIFQNLVRKYTIIILFAFIIGSNLFVLKGFASMSDWQNAFANAPEWVSNPAIEGGIAAIGIGEKSQSAYKSRTIAIIRARAELARIIKSDIKNLLEDFTESVGIYDDEAIATTSLDLSEFVTKPLLKGSRQIAMWKSRNGDTYVLVAIEPAEVKNIIKNYIESNFKKDSVLWQQFRVRDSKAYQKFDQEIEKTFNRYQAIDSGQIKKDPLPPDIYIKNLKFTDPSENYALDGLEKGAIEFDLVNKGRGKAYDLEIKLTPLTSTQNLSFNTTKKIDQLDKKSRKTISIPISADINVQTMKREFRIEVLESYGFDSDPAIISFETLAFPAPDLRIEQIAIDDNEDKEGEGFSYGNGNSIIEQGESIEVTAYVQNFGQGKARDVKAKVSLNTKNRHITCPDQNNTLNLGDIESGDYKKLEFYFYTSRRYNEGNIPLSIKLTEKMGRFGTSSDLGLKLGKRTKNIVEVQIAKAKSRKKTDIRKIAEIVGLSDVDKDIPKLNVNGRNRLAIIIGIEEYKYAPTATYASNDARIFYKYAKSVFGIPEKNIYYRINDGATSGEFNKIFAENGWIARRLQPNQTDVIIYYSGHGAPDPKSKKGYLIPNDIDPNYAATGFSLDKIYSSLSKLKAKSVTVFLDACFSGESRSEQMLIAGARPISIQIENPVLKAENMAVFTASTRDQYSCAYPEKQHGLFTYYLLKGLKGDAKGFDNKLTLKELSAFVTKNVSKTAGYLDKEQTPTFIGTDDSRILLEF